MAAAYFDSRIGTVCCRLKADGPSAHAVALDDDSDEDEERRDS